MTIYIKIPAERKELGEEKMKGLCSDLQEAVMDVLA